MTATPERPSLIRRATQNPWHPLTRFIFWFILRMKDDQAVRWMVPARAFAAMGQRTRRNRNLKLLARGNSARIKGIGRKHFNYLSRIDLHIMRLSVQSLTDVAQSVRTTGEENVAAALKADRGLLLVIGHTGTWWHAPIYLATRGHRLSTVVNPGLPPRVGNYLRNIAGRFGVQISYVGQNAYEAAREALAKKEIFIIAVDRSLREDRSLWVPCGPAELAMDPGPAILALRQRVPVIEAETFHDADGRSCVNYSPQLALGRGTDLPTPEAVLRHWGQSFYERWSRHPEQWWALSFFSLRAPTALTSPSVHRS